jgi:DNA (cytosine-5)-methyltransferase 1
LSPTACRGILRRAKKRGKELPPVLEAALKIQAAIPPEVLAAWRAAPDVETTTEVGSPVSFSVNQRDEVRDLHDLAGAVQASPGMKQTTFVAGCLNPEDTQQSRVFTEDGVAPTLAGCDGGGGRNPAGLVFAAFSSGAGAKAQGIGYEQDCAPTLKSGGGNGMPSILCINDQGGERMDLYENVSGTLRAQMDGHPPLVMATQQGGAEICEDQCPTITACAGRAGNMQPVVFEHNSPMPVAYSFDSAESNSMKSNNPHSGCREVDTARTIDTAVPCPSKNQGGIAILHPGEAYAISATAVDRQPHNGGNGLGIQQGISPTLTRTDIHCVYTQQRSDEYSESGVASTQAARQYKDSTDLVCEVAGLDLRNGIENGNLCGTIQSKNSGGYSLNSVHPIRIGNLVRRLTPFECELLMGFPPFWTDIPGASDSSRYKACGNSLAIPCVEFIMMGIAAVHAEKGE